MKQSAEFGLSQGVSGWTLLVSCSLTKVMLPSLTAIIRHSGVASESCTGSAPRGVLVGELAFLGFLGFTQVLSHKSRKCNREW